MTVGHLQRARQLASPVVMARSELVHDCGNDLEVPSQPGAAEQIPKLGDGSALLAETYAGLSEGFAAIDLRRARQLLTELGEPA